MGKIKKCIGGVAGYKVAKKAKHHHDKKKHRIVFTYDVPHVLLKKTFMYFKVKIFDVIKQEECILQSAESMTNIKGLQFKVITSTGLKFNIVMKLVVKNEQEELFEILPEIQQNTSHSRLTKSAPADDADTMPTIRISNPLFGKDINLIRKAKIPLPISQNLIQIHEDLCELCQHHKPCPKSKFKGVSVLLESNELQFYIRISAPPPNSDEAIRSPIFIDSLKTYDYSQQLGYQQVKPPEDSLQLLATLQQPSESNSQDYSHCLSTPIIIEEIISFEAIASQCQEHFWSLFIAGLSNELQDEIFELSSYQRHLKGSRRSRLLVSQEDQDGELYLFCRKHLLHLDIRRIIRRTNHTGNCILHYAAALQYNIFIDLVLRENERRGKGAVNLSVVNSCDINGRTPLHFAALGGHRSTVICLLAHHATCSKKDIIGKTPLAYARSVGSTDVAKFINRWAQVRETQVLISSLSIEKEKLKEKINELEKQLKEANNKVKKSKKKPEEQPNVRVNPLFGKRSPTKSMQTGKLKLEKGTPVFKSKKKEVKEKKSERLAETRRVREHELRSSLEHQNLLKDSAITKLKNLQKTMRNNPENRVYISEVKNIINTLRGENTIAQTASPSTSVSNLTPLSSINQREKIRQYEREPKALAFPFSLEDLPKVKQVKRKKSSSRKKSKSPKPINSPKSINSPKRSGSPNQSKAKRAKSSNPSLLFSPKTPKQKPVSKSPNTSRSSKSKKHQLADSITSSESSVNELIGLRKSMELQSTVDLESYYTSNNNEDIKDSSISLKDFLNKNEELLLYNEIKSEGVILKRCSSSLLLEWIIFWNKNCNLVETFLSTFRLIQTPKELLDSLLFHWKSQENIIIRKRILFIFIFWGRKYSFDFIQDSSLKEDLFSFLEAIEDDELKSAANSLHSDISKKKVLSRGRCKSFDKSNSTLMDFSPSLLAKHLTIIDVELFLKLDSTLVISDTSTELLILSEHYQEIVEWVTSHLEMAKDKELKLIYSHHFIMIAWECYQLKNYFSMSAISQGLITLDKSDEFNLTKDISEEHQSKLKEIINYQKSHHTFSSESNSKISIPHYEWIKNEISDINITSDEGMIVFSRLKLLHKIVQSIEECQRKLLILQLQELHSVNDECDIYLRNLQKSKE